MRIPSSFPALAAAAAAVTAAAPATAETRKDEAIWVNATVTGTISDRLVFFAEVQPRATDGASRISQVLLRPAIGFAISDSATLYQGYARVVEPMEVADRHEDRSFQQLSWSLGSIGKLEVQSRTRLEKRWRSDGPGMALRARQMMRFESPLAAGERRTALMGWAEGLFGLKSASWGQVTGFDQLRAFAGLEVPLRGSSTVELGYLNQTRDAPGAGVDMAHVASVTFWIRL